MVLMPVLKIIFSAIFIFSLAGSPLFAGTTIDDPGVFDDKEEVERELQAISDSFGQAFANASLMANLSGYPLGSSILGEFPSFVAGISLNAGFSNLERFDDDIQDKDNIYPAAVPAPVFFFGLGLSSKSDVLFKFMLYSNDFYEPKIDNDEVNIKNINTYSVGGRVRYLLVEPVTLIPGIFRFGGIGLISGVDFIYGKVEVDGLITTFLDSVDISGTPQDVEIESDYELETSWYTLSASTAILVYGEAFLIFGAYTGLGAALSYGSIDIDFESQSAVYESGTGTHLGDITITSINSYNPYILSPLYIIGMEINLRFARLSFESMVNLRNRSDINLQFGARVQF